MTVVNPRLRNMSASWGLRGGIGFPIGHRPFRLGEVDMRVPETGGDHAVIAGHERGVGWNFDLIADRRNQAVADQHGSVVDGRVAGRNVDSARARWQECPWPTCSGGCDPWRG